MKLSSLNACGLLRLILSREVSAEEVVASVYERIEEVEKRIRAFITLPKEAAFQRAREIDEKIKKGEKIGRLAGLPIAVKDNICTRGIKTTCASKMLESFIPPYDATVVEKITAEDGIIIGKTNMDEFAMGTSTETSYFGPTCNPWDTTRVPGGSSGGSAAAVASGEAALALGSDTGGSIRCPASFCGTVGLKPTYGLVSRYGLIAYANSLEQIGPLGRTVADCALLLEVIAGRDFRDSTSVESKGGYLGALSVDIAGLKVGILKQLLGDGVHPSVKRCVLAAVEVLMSLGVLCEEVSLPTLDYSLPAYYLLAMSEASSNLARYDGLRYGFRIDEERDWNAVYSRSRKLGFGEEVRRRIILGTYALSAGYFDRYFLKSLKVATLVRRDFDRAFKQFDLLIGPTMPIPPFRLGEKIRDPLSLYMCDINTVSVNLAGLPAISLPCGFTEGLPVGAQLIAPPYREDLAFKVAYAFEKNTSYHELMPPL
ncbi:MAG: Asp-tRNA(Asn)/Glu-tRNA(Gln) amidotransferase subunit GatA [Candidatus Bathyarchaeia archaeon]